MKKLMKELTSISKKLSALAEKLEQMADTTEKEPVQAKPVKEKATKKKAAPKAAKKAAPKKKVAAKKTIKKAAPKATESAETSDIGGLLDTIYGIISTEGTSVAEIKEKSGLSPRQVSNALYKLTKKGLIDAVSRGVYAKK